MAKQQSSTGERQNTGSPTQGQQEVTRGELRRPRYLVRGYDPFGLTLTPLDLFRANPFSLFRRMTEELDRMTAGETSGRGTEQRPWLPTIEVEQREGNYVIRAELPGMKPEDVNVEIGDDAIEISGERKEDEEVERGGVHMTERRYGQFFRRIPLPEGAQADQAKARFENGVREISVPVEAAGSGRRQIKLEGSSSSPGGGATSTSGSAGSSQSGGSEKAA